MGAGGRVPGATPLENRGRGWEMLNHGHYGVSSYMLDALYRDEVHLFWMEPRAPLRLRGEFQEKGFDSVRKEVSSNLRPTREWAASGPGQGRTEAHLRA